MSCKVCEDPEKLKMLSFDAGIDIKYCPVCGSDIRISNFLKDAKAFIKGMNAVVAYTKALEDSKTVIVDGEELIFENYRTNQKESKPKSTPMDMKLDLDKIDITKELSWCNFIGMVDEQSKRKEGKDGQEKL